MRKINLETYFIEGLDEKGKVVRMPYNVKRSLIGGGRSIGLLFHPDLKIGGRELLERGKLADKVDKCDKYVLLEEPEWMKFKDAVEKVQGFSRNDMELVKRVLEAEKVEVDEKTPKPIERVDPKGGARSQKHYSKKEKEREEEINAKNKRINKKRK